jgi:hypothetical protein
MDVVCRWSQLVAFRWPSLGVRFEHEKTGENDEKSLFFMLRVCPSGVIRFRSNLFDGSSFSGSSVSPEKGTQSKDDGGKGPQSPELTGTVLSVSSTRKVRVACDERPGCFRCFGLRRSLQQRALRFCIDPATNRISSNFSKV